MKIKIDPEYLRDPWGYCHKTDAGCGFGTVVNDGYMTTICCSVKGDYARCEVCEMNNNAHNFVEEEA